MIKVKEDLTGKVFGRLTVLYQIDDYVAPYGKHIANWMCQCACGNIISVLGMNLKSGHTKSCGCHKIDMLKKENHYDLSHEYGICYNSEKTLHCIFDKEDYELIKPYYWSITEDEYANAYNPKTKEKYYMHRFILGLKKSNHINDYVDHINGNKLDNRKCNLRICTPSQNMINQKIRPNNTSGVNGVCYSKKDKRWIAAININKKRTVIGYYKNLEEAKIARELAEKEYYRDFSYIKSMEIAEGIKIKDGE